MTGVQTCAFRSYNKLNEITGTAKTEEDEFKEIYNMDVVEIEILAKEGFVVMPYMYPDLNAARDLVNAGAATIMPLAAPIGSNRGLVTKEIIRILVDEIDIPIIVDAGNLLYKIPNNYTINTTIYQGFETL